MESEFNSIFSHLRDVLQRHSDNLFVSQDGPDCYSLAAQIGPATVQAWGGKVKRPTMPVAWVQINKNYVSFHLIGIYMNHTLQQDMSKELKSRMQGKSCFNFKVPDEKLFKELEN